MVASGEGTAAMSKDWYVVEAFEGRDENVALRLAAAGFEVWRPVDPVRSTVRERLPKSNRAARRVRKVARFGRYLFVHVEMTLSVRMAVKDMAGVIDFVHAAGADEPAVVPDEQIKFLREHKPDRSRKKIGFKRGDRVRINAGPFEGHEARVESIDERGVLRVETHLFGRPTPIIIEVGHVETLALGQRPPMSSTFKRCANRSLAQTA